jgi:hypothetical protein
MLFLSAWGKFQGSAGAEKDSFFFFFQKSINWDEISYVKEAEVMPPSKAKSTLNGATYMRARARFTATFPTITWSLYDYYGHRTTNIHKRCVLREKVGPERGIADPQTTRMFPQVFNATSPGLS